MSVITSHACGALHPTSPTLTEVGVDWLLAATRVLSAAKSCFRTHFPRGAGATRSLAMSVSTEDEWLNTYITLTRKRKTN